MAALTQPATKLHLHRLFHRRHFVNAKVKWVRDPYLDTAVLKEKDLIPVLSLKNLILSQPSKTLPISTAASNTHRLRLPTSAAKFIEKYPSVFQQFQPAGPLSLPRVQLTPEALILHREERQVIESSSSTYRRDAVERLAKLLMIAGAGRLPLDVIEKFKFDLGLPHNYLLDLLSDFPEYFQICSMEGKESNNSQTLGLELIAWREELAISALEKRAMEFSINSRTKFGDKRAMPIRYSMKLPNGFDLQKRVADWVEEWQKLPYISPYENAFHLSPNSDQAEKWTVAVLHELLHLLVSKKTDRENLFSLGDYLGFGTRFKKALVHHPGIFYVSNKISMQTVVLREAYRKDFLVEKHPLMGMRFRYIHLMNKSFEQGNRAVRVRGDSRRQVAQVVPKVLKE